MADQVITAKFAPSGTAELQVDIAMDGVTNPKVKIGLESAAAASASVTPDPDEGLITVSKVWSDTFPLVAGAKTLDLAALARAALAAVDMTTKVPRFIAFYNRASNTGSLTIVPGATNGYNVFGASDAKVTLPPGHWIQMGCANLAGRGDLQTVASGDKTIDLSSGQADAVVEVAIFA